MSDALLGPRVVLRPPGVRDAADFLAVVARSRRLHRPWAHPPATVARYLAYAKRANAPRQAGFLVRLRADGALVGAVNLSEIVGGGFRNAYLGYFGDALHGGRGYMAEALTTVLDHAYGRLGLHRVEANIQPGNERSIALVRGLGFRLEGYSPRYLKIGGRWRDHERWALLAEEWRAGRASRRARTR